MLCRKVGDIWLCRVVVARGRPVPSIVSTKKTERSPPETIGTVQVLPCLVNAVLTFIA